jgi:hypothetical protein
VHLYNFIMAGKLTGVHCGRQIVGGLRVTENAGDDKERQNSPLGGITSLGGTSLNANCCYFMSCEEIGRAGGGFIFLDVAVADADDAMGVSGDVRFVGDEDDGVATPVEASEEAHDFFASG